MDNYSGDEELFTENFITKITCEHCPQWNVLYQKNERNYLYNVMSSEL